MRMTWSGAEDFIVRRMPYLIRLNAGRDIEPALQEAVDKPFKVKRKK